VSDNPAVGAWRRRRQVSPGWLRALATALVLQWAAATVAAGQTAAELVALAPERPGTEPSIVPELLATAVLALLAFVPFAAGVVVWRHAGQPATTARGGAALVGLAAAGNLGWAAVSLPSLVDEDAAVAGLAVVLVALPVGYGCVLAVRARRRGMAPEPVAWSRRATLAVAALVLAGYAGAGVAGLAAYRTWREVVEFDFELTPSPRSVLCSGPVDAACAARAAERAGAAVAWLPPVDGLQSRHLLAVPTGRGGFGARQELAGDELHVSLHTRAPAPGPWERPAGSRTVTVAGRRVTVTSGGDPGFTTVRLTWTRAGVTYQLDAYPSPSLVREPPEVDADRALRLVGQVRYTGPP
jgi:hypothetical protein